MLPCRFRRLCGRGTVPLSSVVFAARFMVIAYVKNGGFVVIFFNFCIKYAIFLFLYMES